jgi:hypothetical protein
LYIGDGSIADWISGVRFMVDVVKIVDAGQLDSDVGLCDRRYLARARLAHIAKTGTAAKLWSSLGDS